MKFRLSLGPLVWELTSKVTPNLEALGLEIVDLEGYHPLAGSDEEEESGEEDMKMGFQKK